VQSKRDHISAFHYPSKSPILNHKRQKIEEGHFDQTQAFYFNQNNMAYNVGPQNSRVRTK
jgi:hypothetical protein